MSLFVWAVCVFSVLVSSASVVSPNPDSYHEAFGNPPAASRPLFRYWLPDASVDGSTVMRDIGHAANIGAAGVEFIPFYQYGGDAGGVPPGADWTKYGYATSPFLELFRQALEAHKDRGLAMDFSLGPNQGQGVPAEPNDDGLQWDLVPFAVPVPQNGSLSRIPGWGSGELLALVSAAIKTRTIVQEPIRNLTSLVLKNNAISVISHQVSSDGRLLQRITKADDDEERWVFAFYQRQTLRKNLHYDDPVSEHIAGNGSYTVDHFSARGALTTIHFWEKHILNHGLKSLLKNTGGAGWEDSPEVVSNISWTRSLPRRFEQLHGYDLMPYLPLIMFGNNNIAIQATNPGKVHAVLDTLDRGQGVVNDYRAVLEAGYREYIITIRNWLNLKLGLPFRAQVSYNLPMDMAAQVPLVDIPEVESLGFHDKPDAYKQYTGAAALSGKRVVSNELGAVAGSAFSYTLSSLLYSANRAFTSNVNKFVIHGQVYTGNYYNTTWPGHVPFQYVFSEPFSNKQPAWDNGMAEVMDYLARTQHAMQAGLPRLDIAIYNKVSVTDMAFPEIYNSTDLLEAGYMYAYVTPDNFKLPEAVVKDKVLGPITSSFKAVVIPDRSYITHEAIKDLIKFAKAGLPIVIVGKPLYYPSNRKGDEARTWAAFATLQSLQSVHLVKTGNVANVLHKLGVVPAVRIRSNSMWLHSRRHDSASGLDYVFIMGASQPSSGLIEVDLPAIPYIFDAWTGKKRPLLHYTRNQERQTLTVPLRLAGNESRILVFSRRALKDMAVPDFHITQLPDAVRESQYDPKSGMILHVAHSQTSSILKLSRGAARTVDTSDIPAAIQLTDWLLTAEHWEAPSNLSDATQIASKRNTTYKLRAPLQGWTDLGPQLTNASGVGYYQTSFTWPPPGSADGAHIEFSPALHSIRLWVNGQRAEPLDPHSPVADIGPLLRKGQNQVLAIVPTTMWNYLRSLISDLWCAGNRPFVLPGNRVMIPTPAKSQNGLVGNVTVTPYRKMVVRP